VTGLPPAASRLMPASRLTDGEIIAELGDESTTAQRRGQLEAERAERRALRAAMGQEARRAAARARERAVARLGTGGRP
jgi:hypothetical protein